MRFYRENWNSLLFSPHVWWIAALTLLMLGCGMRGSKRLGMSGELKPDNGNLPQVPGPTGGGAGGQGAVLSMNMGTPSLGDQTLVAGGIDADTVNAGGRLQLSFIKGAQNVTVEQISPALWQVIFNATGSFTAVLSVIGGNGETLSKITQNISVSLRNFGYRFLQSTIFPVARDTFSIQIIGMADGLTDELNEQSQVAATITFPDDPSATIIRKLSPAPPNTFDVTLNNPGENKMAVTVTYKGTTLTGEKVLLINEMLSGSMAANNTSIASDQTLLVAANLIGGSGWGYNIVSWAFKGPEFPVSRIGQNALQLGPFPSVTTPTEVELILVMADSEVRPSIKRPIPAPVCKTVEPDCNLPHSYNRTVKFEVHPPEPSAGASVVLGFSRKNLGNEDQLAVTSRADDNNNYLTAAVLSLGSLPAGQPFDYTVESSQGNVVLDPSSPFPLSGRTNQRVLQIGPFAFTQEAMGPVSLTLRTFLVDNTTPLAGAAIVPVFVSGPLTAQIKKEDLNPYIITKTFKGVNSGKNGGPSSPKAPFSTDTSNGSILVDFFGNSTVGTVKVESIVFSGGTVGTRTQVDVGRVSAPLTFSAVGPAQLTFQLADLFNVTTGTFVVMTDRIHEFLAGDQDNGLMGTDSNKLDCHIRFIRHRSTAVENTAPLTVDYKFGDGAKGAFSYNHLTLPGLSESETSNMTLTPKALRNADLKCQAVVTIPGPIPAGVISAELSINIRDNHPSLIKRNQLIQLYDGGAL